MRKKPTRRERQRERKKKNTHIHTMRHIAVVTHNNIVVSFLSSKLKQMTFCWCFWHDETRAYFILGTTHLERASCSYRTRGNCDRNTRKGFQISFVSCRHFFFVQITFVCEWYAYLFKLFFITRLGNEITFPRIIWALIVHHFFFSVSFFCSCCCFS